MGALYFGGGLFCVGVLVRQWIWISTLVWTVVCFAVNAYTWRITYPLWRFVGDEAFAEVHREYMRQLDLVITVPHVLIFFSSMALLFLRPEWFRPAFGVAVFALEMTVILLSVAVAGPVHTHFTRNGRVDEPWMARLVSVSAVRTLLMLAATGMMVQTLHVRL